MSPLESGLGMTPVSPLGDLGLPVIRYVAGLVPLAGTMTLSAPISMS